jgi:hypothetical protein
MNKMKKTSVAFIVLIVTELFLKFYVMWTAPITNEYTLYMYGEEPIYYCNNYCVIGGWINYSIMFTIATYIIYRIVKHFLTKREKINQP